MPTTASHRLPTPPNASQRRVLTPNAVCGLNRHLTMTRVSAATSATITTTTATMRVGPLLPPPPRHHRHCHDNDSGARRGRQQHWCVSTTVCSGAAAIITTTPLQLPPLITVTMMRVRAAATPPLLLMRSVAKGLIGFVPHRLWVKIDSAREDYQRGLGAHHEQSMMHSLICTCRYR